jgi:predicted PurR-regulated permease PerM
LWTVGLSACLFAASMKRFQALGWMYIVTFFLLLFSRGRSYYLAAAYVMFLAAGSVWFETRLETRTQKMRRAGFGILWSLLVIGSLIGIILMKPIAPINSPLWKITSDINDNVVEMVGWQDLTAQVTDIYRSIPESKKPHTVILAGNYGEAGALEFYGKGLPRIISDANSLWYLGYGQPDP